MCGVFALFLRRPLRPEDIQLGRTGRDALVHRGPDQAGEWSDGDAGVFLGHRRLKIVDLSDAGAQPMQRGRHVVAFNGEVYNFRELRDELQQAGAAFRSEGDTEVLLEAWRRWGAAALDRLDGMFAIALWDGDSAWLARDHFGEKPLFYAETADGIWVSSELPALAKAVGAEKSLDQVTAFLTLGFIPPPATAYRGIFQLRPSEWIQVRGGRVASRGTGWTPVRGTPGTGTPRPLPESDVDRLHAAIADSLRVRLRADVPACTFLSSGVDSSLIAAVVRREFGLQLPAITVSFAGTAIHDEAPETRQVADALGVPLTVLPAGRAGDYGPAALLSRYGQPNDNTTLFPVHQMCAAACAAGYRVGLTGIGGDEIFLGYGKHFFAYRHRRMYNAPEWLRVALAAVLRPLRGWSANARMVTDLVALPDRERYVALKDMTLISALRDLPGFEEWTDEHFSWGDRAFESAVPAYELSEALPASQLSCTDLGSMAASMELRTPYLSRAVQEIVASVDPRAFLAFGQKSVLRRILARYLPRDFVEMPKRGFKFPRGALIDPARATAPQVPGVDRGFLDRVWARRGERYWQDLAQRLVIAAEFAAA